MYREDSTNPTDEIELGRPLVVSRTLSAADCVPKPITPL